MEPKLLRDVLPDLQTNEYLTKKLDHIYVTRLLMPHDRHALKIFIRSDVLIPKGRSTFCRLLSRSSSLSVEKYGSRYVNALIFRESR